MTSSTADQSTCELRLIRACKGKAARSSVRIEASVPPYRPKGVRIASHTNTVLDMMGILYYRQDDFPSFSNHVGWFLPSTGLAAGPRQTGQADAAPSASMGPLAGRA